MRVLFLSRWFPVPADNGSKVRILHLLRALASQHEVTLVAFVSEPPGDGDMLAVHQECAAVYTAPLPTPELQTVAGLLGFFSPQPRSVRASLSREMQAIVRDLCADWPPDVVVSSQIDMAPYALQVTGVPRVLDEVELASYWEQVTSAPDMRRRIRRQLMWAKRAAYTRRVLAQFDAYTVVSEAERALTMRIAPKQAAPVTIPNGADVRPMARRNNPKRGSIIYAGSVTYPPNYEAVTYFVRDILPRVRSGFPEARFTVTGRTDGVRLDELSNMPGVFFVGLVEDIRAAVAGSWLSVAPIRSGGGTRLKILESLALGTPVVATSKGIEGLDLVRGRDVVVADDAAAFAAAVVQVLRDPDLRRRLGDQGRRRVVELYSWERIGAAFCSMVESVVHDRT